MENLRPSKPTRRSHRCWASTRLGSGEAARRFGPAPDAQRSSRVDAGGSRAGRSRRSVMRERARRSIAGWALGASLGFALAGVSPRVASAAPASVDAAVRVDPQQALGGQIPDHFVGVSIEWSLIDRYMGAASRPGFANLLANLRSGLLRIGGSSQDQIP